MMEKRDGMEQGQAIVRVMHCYPGYMGGGAVANAITALAEAEHRAGLQVGIAAFAHNRERTLSLAGQDHSPVGVYRTGRWLRAGSLRIPVVGRHGREVMRGFGPDVIHLHGVFNIEHLVAPLANCPVIWSPHGGLQEGVLRGNRSVVKQMFVGTLKRTLGDRLRCVHALTPSEERDISRRLPGLPITVIPLGATLKAHLNDAALPPPVPGARSLVFVFVGRLDIETKGLDLLIRAFAEIAGPHLAQETVRPRLVLVGPDQNGARRRLDRLTQRLGVTDSIEFTGPLTADEVRATLDRSDWYVQLSRHEGFGTATAEALLAGLPAVLSSNSGFVSYPEVSALPHVVVVEPTELGAIVGLKKAARLGRTLRSLGVASASGIKAWLDWDRLAKQYISMYRAAIAE